MDKSWYHLGDEELFNPNNKPLQSIDYSKVNFKPFFYKKTDKLAFQDNYFTFAYSEHFLEHLFIDESFDLLKECYRVLSPNSIFRIAVPDADLRSYSSPERVGFPSTDFPYTHPAKHKTRWSIYSLTWILEKIGFQVIPIMFCDKYGEFKFTNPNDMIKRYGYVNDPELVFTLEYVKRPKSLIIDRKKPSSYT